MPPLKLLHAATESHVPQRSHGAAKLEMRALKSGVDATDLVEGDGFLYKMQPFHVYLLFSINKTLL